MEKLRAQHLNKDLCNIYQGEIRVLSRDVEVLLLEKKELKQHYKALISAEKKDQEAMLLEIEKLKKGLQKAEANIHEMSREKAACPSTMEELLQQLEEAKRKHTAEKQMLVSELEDLNQQLKTEKDLRVQVEFEKLEALEIAETLFQKLEDMQRVSEERSAESRLVSAELKLEKTKLHHEILELQETLQKEQNLRNQTETENLKDFEIKEAPWEEFDRRFQEEKKLRAEAERNKLEAVKIGEALFQRLEEARTITDKLSAESQMLADKLKMEEKKLQALVQDFVELTQMLHQERVLRDEAENYELEATEIAEALQKRIELLRKRFSARTSRGAAHHKGSDAGEHRNDTAALSFSK